ncbi:hypothetical protein FF098_011460 [Parvularcula flava]|nr:hypothetical protein [Aquisalinus luteolus]NHK28525.1 hypothetical protein [Aquisalinus luteolus]
MLSRELTAVGLDNLEERAQADGSVYFLSPTDVSRALAKATDSLSFSIGPSRGRISDVVASTAKVAWYCDRAGFDTDTWKLIREDIAAVQNENLDPAALLDQKLWRENMPLWVEGRWEQVETYLLNVLDEKWYVWLEWYRNCLNGNVRDVHPDLDRVMLHLEDNDFWDGGVTNINNYIDSLIERPSAPQQIAAPIRAEIDSQGFIRIKTDAAREEVAGEGLSQLFTSLKELTVSFCEDLRGSNISRFAVSKFDRYQKALGDDIANFRSVHTYIMLRNACASVDADEFHTLNDVLKADLEEIRALQWSISDAFDEFQKTIQHMYRGEGVNVSPEIVSKINSVHNSDLARRVQSEELRRVEADLIDGACEGASNESKIDLVRTQYNIWAASKSFINNLGINIRIGIELYSDDLDAFLDKALRAISDEKARFTKDPIKRIIEYIKLLQPVINLIRYKLNL